MERFSLRSKKYIPDKFYNIKADLDEMPKPPLHPVTKEPLKPEDLSPLFPEGFIEEEASIERFIEIPEEVKNIYSVYRPTPLIYARYLKEYLDTPAHIFFKYEGVSPTGSHKTNTAVMQAFLAKKEGIKTFTTETGAGQWGSALSYAGQVFGLNIKVFMVRISYRQKPGRRILIKNFGGDVVESPSNLTESGKNFLREDPEHPGSLGIAISEAVEMALSDEKYKYSLGSVLDAVLLHQTVIGLEAQKQFEDLNLDPDIIIGCVGGGSNFGGLSFPFVGKMLRENKKKIKFIAVEPKVCPTITKGELKYDNGDSAGLTPLLYMHTLGKDFVPPPIHAGGLRYHGMAPLVSHLVKKGIVEPRAYEQDEVFEAARIFLKTEGILPAPESAHAIKAAIDEALRLKKEKEEKVILFNLSGHGFFDITAYDR